MPTKIQGETGSVQGRLMKRKNTFHTWKERMCYLKNGRLQIFSIKRSGKIKGDFHLASSPPRISFITNGPMPYGFVIHVNSTEKLFFCAETQELREMWLNGLTLQCNAVVERSFVSLSTDKEEKKLKKSNAVAAPESGASKKFVVEQPLQQEECTTMGAGRALRDQYSRITFPPALANGDLLMGIGPFVRRVGWTDERMMSVGFYIDVISAGKLLATYSQSSIDDLAGDQHFFDDLVSKKFRKTFVISCRKRISRSLIVEALAAEIQPRVGKATAALKEILSYVEKSFKAGESLVMTCNPDGKFEFRYKGVSFPAVDSPELCAAMAQVFFDLNSIQHDAKRGLIERIPILWSAAVSMHKNTIAAAECGEQPSVIAKQDSHEPSDMEDLDEEDDEEREIIRRESCSFTLSLGPMIEPESERMFKGTLDASKALIGCWGTVIAGTEVSYEIGLYVDVSAMSEVLLRYKGLSVGSLFSDPQFPRYFISGTFARSVLVTCNCDAVIKELCQSLEKNTSAAESDVEALKNAMLKDTEEESSEIIIQLDFLADGKFACSSSNFSAAFGTEVQRVLYDYYYYSSSSSIRTALFQRIPMLLDLAKDDLVHTYRDEITMLKENYQRQAPGTKVKVGYLMLKTKKLGNEKWPMRWCRLDGRTFSYYAHKRKKRPREIFHLASFTVADKSSAEKFVTLSLSCITSGREIVFRTDNLYEGAEWLEELTEASATPDEMKAQGLDPSSIKCSSSPLEEDFKTKDFDRVAEDQYPTTFVDWLSSDSQNQIFLILFLLIVCVVDWLTK